MFKVFSFVLIIMFSYLAYGQTNEYSDEFDILEAPFEINDPANTVGTSDGTEDLNLPRTFEESLTQVEEAPEGLDLQPGSFQGELVEIRKAQDVFLPYKQRQKEWGFLFSAGAELVNYPDLLSQFDDAAPFEDMFGQSGLNMMSVELGPKYNTVIGSLGLYLGYGKLQADDSRIRSKAELDITRYSATLTFYLDTIWPEPYFVPYLGGGIWQVEYLEMNGDEPGVKKRYTSEIGYHWRAGALLGLDWIEPATALLSRRKIGLQATFINVYAASSYMSESSPDPNLENEIDIGVGVVLEF